MQVDLYSIKQAIIEAGEIAALSVLKQTNPASDEIRYTEAVKIAGSERWLMYHIKQGNLKKIRRGKAKNSPIYYSRLEIAALKKAEQEQAKIK